MDYKIGIICPSEIAFRRFLPSLQRISEFTFAGVAIANPAEWTGDGKVTADTKRIIEKEQQKAQTFIDLYGGKLYVGYENMITSREIDAVYIPLPPALHYKWAKLALQNEKHVYLEKPFTLCLSDTQELIAIAKEKKLAVHENYMFIYHRQLQAVQDLIAQGEIGKVRQYRISFGFPRRSINDFRYNKALGGGALLDAGGYCIKYASWLLGATARLVCANVYYDKEFEVDIFGSCTMTNDEGTIVQMSFGMDCDYKCELEAWGSTGTLTTGRILTAPDGLEPELLIKHNQDYYKRKLPSDNAFEKSICRFYDCLENDAIREENYNIIDRQSSFVDEYIKISGYRL